MSDQALDLAIVAFERIEGAEHAYANVLEAAGQASWIREIAFLEHHGHDRIVVRGTFAGHYVDIDDQADVIGRKTAEGVIAGAAVGRCSGPRDLRPAWSPAARSAVSPRPTAQSPSCEARSLTRSGPMCPKGPQP